MEPIRDNEDYKGAVRNVKNGPKSANKAKRVIFKGGGSLDTHFAGYGRDSSFSGLLTCQGILLNQSDTIRTSNELSGTSKMAQIGPNQQKG